MLLPLRLSLLLLLLNSAPTLRANPADCLTAPTQACVFQLAIDVAETKTNLNSLASSIMMVAIAQEKLGSDQSQKTTAHLLSVLHAREANPKVIARVLVYRTAYFRNDLKDAPVLSRQIAAELLKLGPQLDGDSNWVTIAATKYYGHAGALDQIHQQIDAADEGLRYKIIEAAARGLLRSRDIAKATDIINLIPDEKFRAKLETTLMAISVDVGDFARAKTIAAAMTDEDDRAYAYGFIAKYLAKLGRLDEALALATRLEQQGLIEDQPQAASFLTEVYARIGDQARVHELQKHVVKARNFISPQKGQDEVRALAALLAGKPGMLFKQLENADYALEFSVILSNAATAYLNSGKTDLDPFFKHISGEYFAYGLNTLGRIQAENGYLVGATVTFRRLQDLGTGSLGVYDARFALARLLAERGMVNEAIRLSYENQDAIRLSEFAVMIK